MKERYWIITEWAFVRKNDGDQLLFYVYPF